jgi:hypothetical protein
MGMGRLGLDEFRGAFYVDSNIAQPTDYGIWGVATSGEIAESRRFRDPKERSVLEDRQNRPPRDDLGRDDRDLDKE